MGGYQHSKDGTDAALKIARGILDQTIPDPTNGATHFYSPKSEPKKGEEEMAKKKHFNVLGGLESVPGVNLDGKPIESYKPDWPADMDPRSVTSVPQATFKFFRKKGNSTVR